MTNPTSANEGEKLPTYQSAADCPLGTAHGTTSTHCDKSGVQCCDFCGFPVDDGDPTPTAPYDLLAGATVDALKKELERQMEDQADDMTPSSLHRHAGLTWLEGWFDLKTGLAAAAPDLAAEVARLQKQVRGRGLGLEISARAEKYMRIFWREKIAAKDAEIAALREALASVETLAKTMRNSGNLVGPENAAERRVWVKTRYADGRALIDVIRATRAKAIAP